MHTFNFKYKLKTPKSIRNNPDQAQQNELETESIREALNRFSGYSLEAVRVKPCMGGRIITLSFKRDY